MQFWLILLFVAGATAMLCIPRDACPRGEEGPRGDPLEATVTIVGYDGRDWIQTQWLESSTGINASKEAQLQRITRTLNSIDPQALRSLLSDGRHHWIGPDWSVYQWDKADDSYAVIHNLPPHLSDRYAYFLFSTRDGRVRLERVQNMYFGGKVADPVPLDDVEDSVWKLKTALRLAAEPQGTEIRWTPPRGSWKFIAAVIIAIVAVSFVGFEAACLGFCLACCCVR